MKNIKHLLFLSILCSLVLFNACSEDEDPVADDNSTAVLDADGDGVADADDTCADTPSGETVDSSGCSDSQNVSDTILDADSDGVADADDTCADTPSGETVDSSGCSDSQKDADEDGVADDLDTCADTPSGETVDENGCSDSQKDTDGDGVSDDLDTCADTTEGVTVDENGCAVVVVVVSAEIGDALQGGIVAYLFQEGDSGYVAGEIHGLIAATEDQSAEAEWGCMVTEISGADGTAIGTGAQNTLDILAGCSEGGIAAKLAADYEVTVDGVTYDDWFLPSKDELNELYLNQVAIGGFDTFLASYWSSTEFDDSDAWRQGFELELGGTQYNFYKFTDSRVRAVRSF
jgi:hypothetical protein